jgi:dihydroorotate dehydrogenase (fumarate)
MGLELRNPLVAAASPMSGTLDGVQQLAEAGAGAIVLRSLFAEQIERESLAFDAHLDAGSDCFAESLSYLPPPGGHAFGAGEYLDLVRASVAAVDVPIIASLNAGTIGRWTELAREIQRAGAHALELNIYRLATDPGVAGDEIEDEYATIVRAVIAEVTIPVAVKIGPFFSSLPAMARRFDELGARALVLFNRFYQPDIDLEELEVVPHLALSTPWEGRLAMRWIAILSGRVRASLAATTGIHGAGDAIKMLMAGADVAMLCSVLIKRGVPHLRRLLDDVEHWLREHEYESVRALRGIMSHRSCPDPAALERANYMQTLLSWGG